jgi:hypothetical protein
MPDEASPPRGKGKGGIQGSIDAPSVAASCSTGHHPQLPPHQWPGGRTSQAVLGQNEVDSLGVSVRGCV